MKRTVTVLLGAMALALVTASGVAWAATVQCQYRAALECFGTPDADALSGTSGKDDIRALAGADLVKGMGGTDTIVGGRGEDTVRGGTDPDALWGGEAGPEFQGPYTDASDDYVYGGAGGDRVLGGFAQGGTDRVYGGDGDDYMETYQRTRAAQLGVKITKEIVDCGDGYDTVAFDKDIDEVAPNCEQRYPVSPGGEPPPPPPIKRS